MSNHIPPPSNLSSGCMVWAYLRDSSNLEQDQSLPQQRAEIEAFCQQYGLILGRVFQDVARSGGGIACSDAFNDLIELSASANPAPAGLLVWNFARFARDLDEARYYAAFLCRHGITIHSLTDIIPGGPYERLAITLADFINEERRKKNSLDTKRGLQFMFREGYSFGIPPRGYLAERQQIGKKRDGQPRCASRWISDPDLSELVKQAWKLRAEGKSYPEIAQATHGKIFAAKDSWYRFFINKAYLGIGVWGELEISDHHQALIDLATWEAVQAIWAQSRQVGGGKRAANGTTPELSDPG